MIHARVLLCLLLATAALQAQVSPDPSNAGPPPPATATPTCAIPAGGLPAGAAEPTAAASDATLLNIASKLAIRYGGKATTGSRVEARLSPLVRRALNTWAGLADTLKLSVVVAQKADVLIMGRAPLETLNSAVKWVDDAGALIEKCRPPSGTAARSAVVVVLFDDAGFASEAWPGLLDALLERHMITADCVTAMKVRPGSLMVRPSLFFTQHTFDMAGNAAAGDDEYRLGNEVAHKVTQLLVEARFGMQPEVLRWGIGYVAEQRLFGKIYQFNASGMVAAADHLDWPAKTGESLKNAAKVASFSLVSTIVHTAEPGNPVPGQRDAWAVLDYELAKEPDKLAALFTELGALHRAKDEYGSSPDYRGDPDATLAACTKAWAALKIATLCDHLKHVK